MRDPMMIRLMIRLMVELTSTVLLLSILALVVSTCTRSTVPRQRSSSSTQLERK